MLWSLGDSTVNVKQLHHNSSLSTYAMVVEFRRYDGWASMLLFRFVWDAMYLRCLFTAFIICMNVFLHAGDGESALMRNCAILPIESPCLLCVAVPLISPLHLLWVLVRTTALTKSDYYIYQRLSEDVIVYLLAVCFFTVPFFRVHTSCSRVTALLAMFVRVILPFRSPPRQA